METTAGAGEFTAQVGAFCGMAVMSVLLWQECVISSIPFIQYTDELV